MKAVPKAQEQGGAREGAGRPAKNAEAKSKPNNQVDNIRLNFGTSAAYIVGRLKRDRPDIYERLERGGFRSARAAGIAAGIVRVPTPFEQIVRLLPKLSDDERQALREKLR